MNYPDSVRKEIADLERQVESKRKELEVLENRCRHEWGPTVYDPITLWPAGEYGDEPGTMGVDYRRKQWYPATMKDAWTRTCKLCGKKQTTTVTEEKVTKTPKF